MLPNQLPLSQRSPLIESHISYIEMAPQLQNTNRLPLLEQFVEKRRHDIASIIDIYRDIHQHPELSCFELRMASVVAKCLEEIGLDVTTSIGGTGLQAS